MVTEKPMKYKILIVFSAVIVSAFLILLALFVLLTGIA